MFCIIIVLSVNVLYGNSVERTFYMVIMMSFHVLYGNSAEPTCFVWW
jgi:hypothetical protein